MNPFDQAQNPDDHWVWSLYEKGLTLIPLGTAGEDPPKYLVQRAGGVEQARNQWPKTPRERWADWQKHTPSHSQIEEWILKYPGCNFAIVTGKEINVIDADSEESVEFVRNNLTRTPWVVRTGKGAHFYYQVGHNLPIKNSADEGAKLDTRGFGGYVVAPGSTHPSGRPYTLEVDPNWPIDSVGDLPMLSADDIAKINEYRGAPAIQVGSGTQIIFDATKHAPGIEQGVREGSRDANMARLVGKWIQEGLSIDKIIAKAMQVDRDNNPPLGEAVVLQKIQSVVGTHFRHNAEEIVQNEQDTPRTPDGRPLIRWANTTQYRPPAPLDYVIDDYLVAGTTSMIFGGPGACKSFLVQDMGMCVATGQNWHNREVSQGLVFYVAGEGHQDLHNRIHAWKTVHGYGRDDTFPFFHSEHEINLRDAEMIQALVDVIKTELECHQPQLIIVDTLSTNFGGGDENAGDMTDFINHMNGLARDTGAHVMIVHHTGKDKDKGARGNSSSHGNVYTYMPVDEKDGLTRLTMMKQKGGPQMKPLGFRMDLVDLGTAQDHRGRTLPVTSLVPRLELDGNTGADAAAQIIDTEKKKQASGMNQRITQRAIQRLAQNATTNPPTIDQKTLYETLKTAGIPEKKTTEYKNYALSEGWIEENGNREFFITKKAMESYA